MFQLSAINGLLFIMLLCFVWMVVRFNNSDGNTYNIVDILMGANNRASMQNHVLVGMAMLSGWVIIDREMDGRDDVGTILLGVLGIFVAGKTATTITDIIKKPDAPSQVVTETTTKHVETTSVQPLKPTNPLLRK